MEGEIVFLAIHDWVFGASCYLGILIKIPLVPKITSQHCDNTILNMRRSTEANCSTLYLLINLAHVLQSLLHMSDIFHHDSTDCTVHSQN